MPDNVFDWEPICKRHPHEGARPGQTPTPVNLHVNRRGRHRQSAPEYDYRICEKKHQADDGRKKFGGMPMKVITRRLFFGLAQSWLEGMLEKACETAVAGVDDYDIVPSNQDIRDSEPDWDVVTNVEDWIWVEKTDAKN
ncbi:hypothetical protein QBC41DRAFT_222877 [Cercophora samala]|uniref:Uncharacterized protein n=1 Tax=Cercophora samala TaxID=330535 RepID=A0AA39ZG33_9PEZI|nr:hypothetical protein QBC41DRAFT_222877 [Cercophora samala]